MLDDSSSSENEGLQQIQKANQILENLEVRLNNYRTKAKSLNTRRTKDSYHDFQNTRTIATPLDDFFPVLSSEQSRKHEVPYPFFGNQAYDKSHSPMLITNSRQKLSSHHTSAQQQENINPNISRPPEPEKPFTNNLSSISRDPQQAATRSVPTASTPSVQQQIEYYKKKLTEQKETEVVNKIEEFYLMRVCLLEEKITQLEATKCKTRRQKQLLGKQNTRLRGLISTIKQELKHLELYQKTSRDLVMRRKQESRQERINQLRLEIQKERQIHDQYEEQKAVYESKIRVLGLQHDHRHTVSTAAYQSNSLQRIKLDNIKKREKSINRIEQEMQLQRTRTNRQQSQNKSKNNAKDVQHMQTVKMSNKNSKSTNLLARGPSMSHCHNRHRVCCVMHDETHSHNIGYSQSGKKSKSTIIPHGY